MVPHELVALPLLLLASLGKPNSNATASPLAVIRRAPEVRLVDSANQPFTLSSLRGKAVIVSFIYTTCSGSCPATTLDLSRVEHALKEAGLWRKRVEFVSISLDPVRDRPETLARYAKLYGADTEGWHFLTGPPDAVANVIAAWGMWAKVGANGVLDHPSRVFLVDPNGDEREIYNLESLTPRVVVQDVKTVLADDEPVPGEPSKALSPRR